LAEAQAQTKDGITGLGLTLGKDAIAHFFADLIHSNGGEILAEDLTKSVFNSPEGVEAVEFLKSLIPYSADGYMTRHWPDSAALMAQ
ncbi:hypothetical protein KMT30_49595, partial [Streptomyces sp. IBSBF 2953]|nr:hypothetical protein [Streptomyces hayashii]